MQHRVAVLHRATVLNRVQVLHRAAAVRRATVRHRESALASIWFTKNAPHRIIRVGGGGGAGWVKSRVGGSKSGWVVLSKIPAPLL